MPSDSKVTDEFVVATVFGSKSATNRHSRLLLFNRWTFQLVNSLAVKCDWLGKMCVIAEGGAKALYFDCHRNKETSAFLWHLATGKLHALPFPASKFKSISFGKLIVLITEFDYDEGGNVAHVY